MNIGPDASLAETSESVPPSSRTRRCHHALDLLVPLKFDETSTVFLSPVEIAALTALGENHGAYTYTYALLVDSARKGQCATAGRGEDGLFVFATPEFGCLAIVKHPKYGEGRVTEIRGTDPAMQMITATFEDGKARSFDTRWAPLTWVTKPDRSPARFTLIKNDVV